ncbi:MAG: dTDP-4-amino-4,6-dideoxygalactose transaminase [Actinomycetota bacterium]|nr:dTDP-4-amino-4,6-dideoxygalactose transaminase [Actinomycetota bacterium]
MIPFNKATFEGKELSHLGQAVIDGHLSGNGPFTRQAESMLEQCHGSGRTLLTTSCTHALEMSARLLDLRPGDEVIVPSFTFVSTASAFMLHGGTPVFVDVRDDTLNIDPDLVEQAITPRTRAICIVHYAGVAATPDRFREIADRHGLMLIEDNAHGLLGTHAGRLLGTFGHLSTLSFHETKNITCGEGGALHVNDLGLLERAEILREKGTDRSRFLRGQVDKYTWVDVGSSWVLSDLLAALLVGQLERFPDIQARRASVWQRYDAALADWAAALGVRSPHIPPQAGHTSHMYFLRLSDLDQRTRFIAHLKERGVMAVFHYQPLHLSAVGVRLGGRSGQCPVSELAGDTLVRLPLHNALTDSDVDRVLSSVTSFRG